MKTKSQAPQSKWMLSAIIGALLFVLCALSFAQTPSVSPVVPPSCPTTSMNVTAGKNVPIRDDGEVDCHECDLRVRKLYVSLEGTVFDQKGRPAPDVQVMIESKPLGRAFTPKTGKDG